MGTTVWRYQNEKGRGPYYHTILSWPAGYHPSHLRPEPCDDFSVFAGCRFADPDFRELVREYEFAFPSKAAADEWFDGAATEVLQNNHFYLVEIEACEVLVSDSGRQCMFRRLVPFQEPAPMFKMSDVVNDPTAEAAKKAVLERVQLKVARNSWSARAEPLTMLISEQLVASYAAESAAAGALCDTVLTFKRMDLITINCASL